MAPKHLPMPAIPVVPLTQKIKAQMKLYSESVNLIRKTPTRKSPRKGNMPTRSSALMNARFTEMKYEKQIRELELEVSELRAEAEESQLTIAKLAQEAKHLEAVEKENALIKSQFMEIQQDCQKMSEQLKAREGSRSATPRMRDRCPSCMKLHVQKSQLAEKNAELQSKNKSLGRSYRKLETQTLEYQKEYLDSLGIHESLVVGSRDTGGLGVSWGPCSKNCDCDHMHHFLRVTIEHIRKQLEEKVEEITTLKMKQQQDMMNTQQLQSEIERLVECERNSLENAQKQEGFIVSLTNEIDRLQKMHKEKLEEGHEAQVTELQKDNAELVSAIKNITKEYETKISIFQKELEIEKQRSDLILTQSIEEREAIEQRWKKAWDSQNEALAEQLNSIKENYEHPLKSAHSRELSLHQEVVDLKNQHQHAKGEFDTYRKVLNKELTDLKDRYVEKCKAVDELRRMRVESEIIMTKKIKDLELCQEMLNKGVDERAALTKKLDAVQNKLKSFLAAESKEEMALQPHLLVDDNPLQFTSWFIPSTPEFPQMESKADIKTKSSISVPTLPTPKKPKSKKIPERLPSIVTNKRTTPPGVAPPTRTLKKGREFTIGRGREARKKSKPSTSSSSSDPRTFRLHYPTDKSKSSSIPISMSSSSPSFSLSNNHRRTAPP